MLLASEGVDLHFTEAAVHEIARVSEELNIILQNIGARSVQVLYGHLEILVSLNANLTYRRLHTVMERIVEPISFSAPELVSQVRVFVAIKVVLY